MDAQSLTEPLEHVGMADELQVGFNPVAHPIIARHFFGVEPFRPICEVAAEVVADIRLRRRVEQPHERRTA